MMMAPLAWTLLTVSLWTLGSSQILKQEPVKIRYPEILSTEAIECDCTDIACDSVSWFRSIHNHSKLEYLGKCNNADRAEHGDGVDELRFKLNKQSMSFSLRIINVTEDDTGIYSCVLKDSRQNIEMWKPRILLRPGVIPPTLPPKTKPKPPVKSVCRCPREKSSQAPVSCGYLVLWPLAGLDAALTLALICTLYYFSRLPKKCRHRFMKR